MLREAPGTVVGARKGTRWSWVWRSGEYFLASDGHRSWNTRARSFTSTTARWPC